MIPSISAVIPCYNQGPFLTECINALLQQSVEIGEIIVVDDGSTDPGTIALIEGTTFPKTRIIQKQNGGPSSTRNTGIREATGEFVLLIDADDYFAPNFTEKAMRILQEDPSVGAVSCWVQFFGRIHHVWKCEGGGVLNFLTQNNSSSAALIRKALWEQISGYDEALAAYEDWDFWLRLTALDKEIRIIEEPLFFYRKHAVSLLAASESNYLAFCEYIFNKNRSIYDQHHPHPLLLQRKEILNLKQKIKKLESHTPASFSDLINLVMRYTKRYLHHLRNN